MFLCGVFECPHRVKHSATCHVYSIHRMRPWHYVRKMASLLSVHASICTICVCVQVVEVNGLAKPSLRQCGEPFALFPNWVSLSYLAAGLEKATAVHSLCQPQQIGFLQFKLAFPKPGHG